MDSNDGECLGGAGTSELFDGVQPRELTELERDKVEKQVPASSFRVHKVRHEVQKNWDKFYRRNKQKFFKDRWWTQYELIKLCTHLDFQQSLIFVEVGCGVGNTLFPLAEQHPHWHLYGLDFSANAIRLLGERAGDSGSKIVAFVADIGAEDFVPETPPAHLASLVFVLSAIMPEHRRLAVRNVRKLLAPNGTLIVRDYGVNDHAMIRFGRGCKLAERLYARQDGTIAYFFQIEELDELFLDEGFVRKNSNYIFQKTTNHQMNLSVDRVFVQATYIRVD